MLEDNEMKELQPYLDQVALVQEKGVDIVTKAFEMAVDVVAKTPAGSQLPRFAVLERAKSVLDSMFNNQPKEGVEFEFVLFGAYQDPKDWNDKEFKSIQEGIDNQQTLELCKQGLLMSYDGKPISKILSSTTRMMYLKGTELYPDQLPESTPMEEIIITDAEFWEKGKGEPIKRDNSLYSGAFPNTKGWSKPLKHRWNLSVAGMAWPKGKKEEARLFETTLQYGQADPSSDEFFFKHFEAFTPYVSTFTIDTAKTTDYKYVLKTNKLSPNGTDMDMSTFDINLERFLRGLVKKHGQLEDIPEFLNGLSKMRDYHVSACRKEADGTISKSPSGWHSMKWNRYAILAVHVSGRGDPDKSNRIKYYFNDSSYNEQMTGKTAKGMVYVHPKEIPGRCMMLVKTSWSPKAWDPLTSGYTYQPDNKNIIISVYSIKSIGMGIDLSNLSFDGL